MSQPLITLLESLTKKIEKLSDNQAKFIERIRQLEEDNASLRTQLFEEKRNLEIAQKDIEFLTVSHKLAESPDALIATRRRIARLIRTIDNCIAMINED